ncbi:hypothetical protein CRYUN_Cryun27aG0057500 [Craigia yunnanensis]
MKFNIANPIQDAKRSLKSTMIRNFEHFLIRGSHRRSAEMLLEKYAYEFKGYVFKIMGGCDKQGFPMKQGVLTPARVRLLLHRAWSLLFNVIQTRVMIATLLAFMRKRARIAEKKKKIAKAKADAAEYQKLLAQRLKEQRERRSGSLAKKKIKAFCCF